MPKKVRLLHPDLYVKDGRRSGKSVVVEVLPRQAKVLAESGWVPAEATNPEPAKKSTPRKKPSNTENTGE